MTDGLSPGIYATLRQLGLTEYAARCYVALLTLREAEASAVAEAADVPRTKVYAVLKDLVDAGWVLASQGRPVQYRPVAPEERIVVEEKRFAEQVADATRELQARYAMGAQTFPVSMYMLRGAESARAKVEELVVRARSELFVNLGFPQEGDRALLGALRRAQERGVTVRLLVGPGVEAEGARVAVFPFRAVVSDWRQAVVMLPGQDEPIALWNPTQAFIEAMRPLMLAAWESAPPA